MNTSPSHPGITNTWTDRLVFLLPPSAVTLGSCSRSKWAVCIQNHFAALMPALSPATKAAAHCPFTSEWTVLVHSWVNSTHSQLSELCLFTAKWTVHIHNQVICKCSKHSWVNYFFSAEEWTLLVGWTVLIQTQSQENLVIWRQVTTQLHWVNCTHSLSSELSSLKVELDVLTHRHTWVNRNYS